MAAADWTTPPGLLENYLVGMYVEIVCEFQNGVVSCALPVRCFCQFRVRLLLCFSTTLKCELCFILRRGALFWSFVAFRPLRYLAEAFGLVAHILAHVLFPITYSVILITLNFTISPKCIKRLKFTVPFIGIVYDFKGLIHKHIVSFIASSVLLEVYWKIVSPQLYSMMATIYFT